MKKKILALNLCIALLLPAAGCITGGDGGITEEVEEDGGADSNSGTESMQSAEENGTQNGGNEVDIVVYAEYIRVTVDNVNIRGGAGTGYTVLGTAEQDTYYALAGETDGWYKINYLGGTAYISKNYAENYLMATEDRAVENVIEQGAKLLGTPYVYGAVRCHDGKGNLNSGFTTSQFDCSSLTQYIFYKGADVLLNVTTRTQILQGTTVDVTEIKRGDLLFFTNASRYNNSGIERVGHVALYLGNNLILHTSSDYAKIEEISSARWGYFLQAQRML